MSWQWVLSLCMYTLSHLPGDVLLTRTGHHCTRCCIFRLLQHSLPYPRGLERRNEPTARWLGPGGLCMSRVRKVKGGRKGLHSYSANHDVLAARRRRGTFRGGSTVPVRRGKPLCRMLIVRSYPSGGLFIASRPGNCLHLPYHHRTVDILLTRQYPSQDFIIAFIFSTHRY